FRCGVQWKSSALRTRRPADPQLRRHQFPGGRGRLSNYGRTRLRIRYLTYKGLLPAGNSTCWASPRAMAELATLLEVWTGTEFCSPAPVVRYAITRRLSKSHTRRALHRGGFCSRTCSWFSICGRPLSGKGKRWGRCCAWSDAVICPAFDAAGRQPPACMGVRGLDPDHPYRARSTVQTPGCPGPVSPTVAAYSPSSSPHILEIVVSLTPPRSEFCRCRL